MHYASTASFESKTYIGLYGTLKRLVAPQLSVVGIKCLKLWVKSGAHLKMLYIGNTPRIPVFIEDFSDECLIAV